MTQEKPILFSGPMVRAILDGRKKQTRRVVRESLLKVRLPCSVVSDIPVRPRLSAAPGVHRARMNRHGAVSVDVGGNWLGVKPDEFEWVSPYGQSGTLLWVRETWAFIDKRDYLLPDHVEFPGCYQYRADSPNAKYPGDWPAEEAKGNPDAPKWRPSIHMPKWACQLWLRVKNVRVERLQEIDNEGCRAEGVMIDELTIPDGIGGSPHCRFTRLWDSINTKRGFGWNTNPWVWVVEFERTDAPQ